MGKPSYPRTRRINAIIREVLADEVEALSDPRLGMVTITGVETSPDMRKATVYVSALEQSHLEESIKGLTAAAPRLRTLLGQQVRIKYTPQLDFKADPGVIQGERIEAVLREIAPRGATPLGPAGHSPQDSLRSPEGEIAGRGQPS